MKSPDGPVLSRGYDMTSTGDQESEDSMTLPWDSQGLIRREGSKRNPGQLIEAAGRLLRSQVISSSVQSFGDLCFVCFSAQQG